MPRKPAPQLTEAELRLMRVLWDKEKASVNDIVAALDEDLAYNTVLTILTILERKGFVGHEKVGRAFVFFPRVDRRNATRNALRRMLQTFFNDSPENLVLHLLEEKEFSPKHLKRLKKLIQESE